MQCVLDTWLTTLLCSEKVHQKVEFNLHIEVPVSAAGTIWEFTNYMYLLKPGFEDW